MILVVVLVIILLLGVLGATFSFEMNAKLAAVRAARDIQQAKLAADSGIDRVLLLLRDERTDMGAWYDNPDAFRRVPVWLPGKEPGSESMVDKMAVEGEPAWRYSIVAYDRENPEDREPQLRFGLTDEAGKLNINVATRLQLVKLFEQLKLTDVDPKVLADSLIDWRDEDNNETSTYGAESSYYMTLEPPYRAKNRPFETVEELLMVKGFNGRILYGEDWNRNGYLDPNEDDGGERGEEAGTSMFPPDNGDGILNTGLLPLITVHSWDWNRSNDNKLRLNINKVNLDALDKLPKSLTEGLTSELSQEVIDFIVEARKRGYTFRSVGELLGLEVDENGKSNYDEIWEEHNKQIAEEEKALKGETQPAEEDNQERDSGSNQEGSAQGDSSGQGEGDTNQGEQDDENDDSGSDKSERRRQALNPGSGESNQNEDRRGDGREAGRQGGGRLGGRRPNASQPQQGGQGGQGNQGGQEQQNQQAKKFNPDGDLIRSPVDEQSLAVLLDRLTTKDEPIMAGLINVNTASSLVLRTIPGLTEQEADSLVAMRKRLDAEQKATTAWVPASGALSDPKKFALICDQLTARSIQFTIDAIGFADHIGVAKRIQVVVEMQGHVAQIKYYRDITSLGIGYPLTEEAERRRGFEVGG